jgi:putative transposase
MYSWTASRAKRNIVFSCQDHGVLCRKYRRHVLVNGVERRLKQISAEVVEETDSILVETEVMPDHVHLLIDVDPRLGIHRVVKAIKGRSSRSRRNEFAWLKSTFRRFGPTVTSFRLATTRNFVPASMVGRGGKAVRAALDQSACLGSKRKA